MKRIVYLLIITIIISVSCKERNTGHKTTPSPVSHEAPADAVPVANDIVTEIIIKPDTEGDPWDIEKVSGYTGSDFIDDIFKKIYDGSMTVYDYHSGEALSVSDVRKIENEFGNDRSKIGKLSFTEDWYYYPSANRLEKRTRSVTFGYELYNNLGKVYAYQAAFRADLE
jgi:hypothetical protein